jgi:hypothetical protein
MELNKEKKMKSEQAVLPNPCLEEEEEEEEEEDDDDDDDDEIILLSSFDKRVTCTRAV